MIQIALDSPARKYGVSSCIGCGKCTWACPVSHGPVEFSPRKVVEDMTINGKLRQEKGLWDCMTCGMCTELCPSGVRFHEFMREARPSVKELLPPSPTHSDIFRIVSNLSSQRHIRPKRVNWLQPGLRTDESSNVLLFVGCTPYFDIHFRNLRQDLLEIPRAAVRLLNAMGIEPRILSAERCCGHDAYWLGDEEAFLSQARANLEEIWATGVEEVVAFCPECYSTLRSVYPRHFGHLGFELRSLTALVGEAVSKGSIQLDSDGNRYTYQDPCRLARHSGIVAEPREVIGSVGELAEMPRSGSIAACCGTSCWTNCSSSTKEWQAGRLREARETGASALVTACPKCLIHLTCAQKEKVLPDPSISIPLIDLHVLASSRLKGREEGKG